MLFTVFQSSCSCFIPASYLIHIISHSQHWKDWKIRLDLSILIVTVLHFASFLPMSETNYRAVKEFPHEKEVYHRSKPPAQPQWRARCKCGGCSRSTSGRCFNLAHRPENGWIPWLFRRDVPHGFWDNGDNHGWTGTLRGWLRGYSLVAAGDVDTSPASSRTDVLVYARSGLVVRGALKRREESVLPCACSLGHSSSVTVCM